MSKKNKRKNKPPAPEPAQPSKPPASQGPAAAAGAAARVIIGLVFLVSGFHKIAAPAEEFAVVIEAYHLAPPSMIGGLSVGIPFVEIFLGLGLIAGFAARSLAAAGGGLFLLFIGALLSTILRGIPLENCGCFGGGIHLTPPQAIGLDSLLVCLAYLAWRKGGAYAPLDHWIEQGK